MNDKKALRERQVIKIKMLTEMLIENIDLLNSFPTKLEERNSRMNEHKEKYGDAYWGYEQYPIVGTSESHIKDITKLLRKELLKL